jgi:hypothetical protein
VSTGIHLHPEHGGSMYLWNISDTAHVHIMVQTV